MSAAVTEQASGPGPVFARVAPDARERALMVAAVRLLSGGRPVEPSAIAMEAGVESAGFQDLMIGPDIEYDDAGSVTGWALSLTPTVHRFTYRERELYTWCGPDTLVFARLLGGPVDIGSQCPVTGGDVRVRTGADGTLADLWPATAQVGYVPAEQIRRGAVRTTCCKPQRFLADEAAAERWRRECPGMTVLPVDRAYAESAGVLGG